MAIAEAVVVEAVVGSEAAVAAMALRLPEVRRQVAMPPLAEPGLAATVLPAEREAAAAVGSVVAPNSRSCCTARNKSANTGFTLPNRQTANSYWDLSIPYRES